MNDKRLPHVEAYTVKWPNNLVSAESAAEEIGLTPERLIDFANAGFAPHFRIDGGEPLFLRGELKEWAANNILKRDHGRPLPVQIVVSPTPVAGVGLANVPAAIRPIKGLCDITGVVQALRDLFYLLAR